MCGDVNGSTMSLDPRQSAALAAALDRVAQTVAQAAVHAADPVAQQSLAAVIGMPRDVVSAAQFELRRQVGSVGAGFLDKLREKVARDTLPRDSGRTLANTDWTALTLVEDHEVEAQVGADRLGRAIAHDSEWELRELDALMGALLRTGAAEHERNPLRPELIGQALFATIDTVSKDEQARKAPNDIVTGTDVLVQDVLQQVLREHQPDVAFLGEERAPTVLRDTRRVWLVVGFTFLARIKENLSHLQSQLHSHPVFKLLYAEAGWYATLRYSAPHPAVRSSTCGCGVSGRRHTRFSSG